jgi:hypothetical protein
MNKLIKNLSIFYLIYSIALYTNPAFALGSNLGGWIKTSTSRSGATSTYNGSRSYNSNYGGQSTINTTASLVPLGIDVASMLLKGTGWGLAVTALGIAYQGYEAVQDFQNNRVKLSKTDSDSTTSVYRWKHSNYGGFVYGLSSAVTVANIWTSALQRTLGQFESPNCSWTNVPSQSAIKCTAKRVQTNQYYDITIPIWDYNPNYNPNVQPINEIVFVPLPAIGDMIIAEANSLNQDAIDFVAQVADTAWTDAPASQAMQNRLFNELNKNAQYPSQTNVNSNTDTQASTTQPNASGTTTTNSHSTTSTELPAFCSYASKLCDWLDWSQAMPLDEEKKEVEIKTSDIAFNQTAYINVSASCPSPVSVSFGNFGNINIDFTMFCNVLSIVRPAIISASLLGAIFIVMGVRDE